MGKIDTMLGRLGWMGALLAALAWPLPVHAQEQQDDAESAETGDNVTRARKLAQDSLVFLEDERYVEALEHAQHAEKLYHAPIHLRVMGQALEGLGRRAEAASVYERLAAEPLPPTAHPLFHEAKEFAKTRLKELTAALPSVLVKVEGVPPEEAKVTLDGKPFDPSAETAVRVDPGPHRVHVEAPGRIAFDQELELEEGMGVVIVTARMRKPGEPESDEPVITITPPPGAGVSSPPVGSWVLFGVGAAALVAGGVTGGLALARASELDDSCPDKRCPPSLESDHEQAEILGWTSTVALGVGGACVVAAGLVWLLDGGDEEEEGVSARLEIGPGSAFVRGRF